MLQAEESEIKENMKKYQDEIDAARLSVERSLPFFKTFLYGFTGSPSKK